MTTTSSYQWFTGYGEEMMVGSAHCNFPCGDHCSAVDRHRSKFFFAIQSFLLEILLSKITKKMPGTKSYACQKWFDLLLKI